MRKTLGIAAVAISLTGGATVVLAQSSRNLMEVTGTEANRVQTQYGRYTPGSSRVCVLAALAPPMALVSPALVICRNGLQRRYCNQLISVAYDRFGSFSTDPVSPTCQFMSASPRKRTSLGADGMSALCHVWTAPSWQGFSSRLQAGRCSHVFGLLARHTGRWP